MLGFLRFVPERQQMIRFSILLALACALASSACVPPDNVEPVAPVPCTFDESGNVVRVSAYADENASDLSSYAGGFEASEDTRVVGLDVQLFTSDGVLSEQTCDEGYAAFGNLEEGHYLAAPSHVDGGLCSQKNCTRRFPEAVSEGASVCATSQAQPWH